MIFYDEEIDFTDEINFSGAFQSMSLTNSEENLTKSVINNNEVNL